MVPAMFRSGLTFFAVLALPALAQMAPMENNVLFVKLKPGHRLPRELNLTHKKRLFGGLYQLKTGDLESTQAQLATSSAVEWVDQSYLGTRVLPRATKQQKEARGSVRLGVNDPKSSVQWALGASEQNGVSYARAQTITPNWAPTPVLVGVLDTGVDYRHEDLRENVWRNPGEIPGNGVDDDDNGFVDDLHGIDLIGNDSDPNASSFHGTHVAGIIAAQANNGRGVVGATPHARILPVRMVPDETNEADSDVIAAMLYAAKNGAKIINCSFGKNRQSKAVEETITHLGEEYGVLVVAAAGNDSNGPSSWYNLDRRPQYPVSFRSPNLLTVTATAPLGNLASFSNIGANTVDVAAPGDQILSTMPRNDYGYCNGTSMATPLVAGIAAHVLAYYPKLTPVELKDVITGSASPVAALKGRTKTGGRADLAQALEYASQHFPEAH